MESHPFALKMQKEMIREVETAKPEYLVFVGVPTSWLKKPHSNPLVFNWINSYLTEFHERIGIIDIVSNTHTVYLWEEKSKNYIPQSNCNLLVFKRTHLWYLSQQYCKNERLQSIWVLSKVL